MVKAFLTNSLEKLQSDFNRVVDESSTQRHTRTELSQEILRDARVRLAMVQQQVLYILELTIQPV